MDVTQSSSLFSMSGLSQMRSQLGGRPPPSHVDQVAEFDSDARGGLSAEEVGASALSGVISNDTWGDVDTDGDSSLSVGELDSHREAARGDCPPPPPTSGGGGGMSDTSDASAASLILSLFEKADVARTSTDTNPSAMANSLHANAQDAIGLFASAAVSPSGLREPPQGGIMLATGRTLLRPVAPIAWARAAYM